MSTMERRIFFSIRGSPIFFRRLAMHAGMQEVPVWIREEIIGSVYWKEPLPERTKRALLEREQEKIIADRK